MVIKIQTHQVLIDKESYSLIKDIKWYLNKTTGYVQGRDSEGKTIYLHRVIMGATEGQEIDHKNHNKLDCRLKNLRTCTRQQNLKNRKSYKNSKTGIKGVHFSIAAGKYQAEISCDGKYYYLGLYVSALDAARAYNAAAKVLHGEFAYLNCI